MARSSSHPARPMTARRALALVLAPLGGALVASVVSLGASAVAPAAKPRTTSVGVGLREYSIALTRSRVLPGRVRFKLRNLGDDLHDLQVSGPGGSSKVRGTSAKLTGGERGTLTVTLRTRGAYRLICTVGDHAAEGMVTRLRVVKAL